MIRSWRSCRVVFDGQSRVVAPGFWTGNVFLGWSWPRIMLLGRGIPAYIVAVSGRSFTWLIDNWEGRADTFITPAGHPANQRFTSYAAVIATTQEAIPQPRLMPMPERLPSWLAMPEPNM